MIELTPSNYTLLLADAKNENLAHLENYLCQAGYNSLLALSGREAIEKAVSHQPDMVLVDMKLSDMDGYEFCRRMQQEDASIPVIILAAMHQSDAVERVFESGGVDYILKPVRYSELLSRVKIHLRIAGDNQLLQQKVDEKTRAIEAERDRYSSLAEGFRTTLCSIAEAVISTDLNRDLVSMNPAAEKLTACKFYNAQLQRWNRCFQFEDAEVPGQYIDPVAEVIKTGKICNRSEKTFLINYQNQRYLINYSAAPVKNDRGEIIGVVLVFRDMTGTCQIKESLEKREGFLRNVLESIQDGISVLDVDLKIQHVNHVMENWYVRNMPLVGKKCYACYHDKQEPCNPCPTIRCMESGKTEKEVISGLPGSPVEYIELYSYPMKDQKTGKIEGVIEFVRDITDRKNAEFALKEREDRLSKTLMAANDGMWDWNLMNNNVFFDQRYYEMAGYQKDAFPHNLDEFKKRLHPDDVAQVMQHAKLHLEGEIDRFVIEFRFLKKNGDWLWILGRGIIVERDHHGTPTRFIGTHTDITDRKRMEEALRKSNEELEKALKEARKSQELEVANKKLKEAEKGLIQKQNQLENVNQELKAANTTLNIQRDDLQNTLEQLKAAQAQLVQSEKMASIGVLTAGVAHELNNPLNFINSGVAALETTLQDLKLNNNKEVQQFIGHIKTGIDRSAKIIKSMNHFSRESSESAVRCNVHTILDNCMIILQHRLKHKVELKKAYTNTRYELFGDEGKLHQAFLNILTNAEQAIEDNGIITTRTSVEGNTLRVEITDNGSGIDEVFMEKIMDPFFTTKQPGEGTGLGLSITYNILKEHSGELKVDSKKGKGTSVTVMLPINQ